MSSAVQLDIACLCADWCGTCREYADTFAALQQALPGHRYRWIDIEDESDLVGDVDVETFPTLLVAAQGHVLFAGPVLPRLADAQRLVEVQQSRAAEAMTSGRWPAATAQGVPADQWVAFSAVALSLARAED
ncbi:MAG: thioredoxin family protein [Aquabacterium sp.]|uniref:thioredoxin family protein n=1 Tax=Aquabacterium sp. TaxID=1872578 RepID=UPI003BBAF46C